MMHEEMHVKSQSYLQILVIMGASNFMFLGCLFLKKKEAINDFSFPIAPSRGNLHKIGEVLNQYPDRVNKLTSLKLRCLISFLASSEKLLE